MSACMYPKVFDQYKIKQKQFGSALPYLPSRAFFWPLDEDEEIDINIDNQ